MPLTLEDAHSNSRRWLTSTGGTSTATRTTFDHSTLCFCRTEKTILRIQLYPPRTTVVSGEITCLLPPSAGGSLTHNRGKIGCSIQAVLKVVSAPARLWERSARCFVGRLCVGRLDETATYFVTTFARVVQANYPRRIYCRRSLFLRS